MITYETITIDIQVPAEDSESLIAELEDSISASINEFRDKHPDSIVFVNGLA